METVGAMHRLSTVRRQLGVSLREISRRMRKSRGRLTCQEVDTSDIRLSELWAWQSALGVPMGKLLIDRDSPLEGPETERSQIDRLATIAANICDHSESLAVERLARAMLDQLREIMPEEER